jgi:RimJ/RimL family protein N-acetyltransferase
MAFGHWMEIDEGQVRLRLGPVRRDEAKRFVAADAGFGMQSYEVTRWLGPGMPPTEEGEEEWWDKASKDNDKIMWGVYVPDGDDAWKLIGSTMLAFHGYNRRRAESGFMVFDRAHWRRRVASTAHLGRTQYAFHELDLAITSAAYAPNIGSNRALQGVGYVQTGTNYGDLVVGGKMIDANVYLMPNPAEEAWRYFWRRPEEEIPEAFVAGRRRTLTTLERAAAAVRFL